VFDGNDMEQPFWMNAKRFGVDGGDGACCKEATLRSARTREEAAPAWTAASWNWGSEIGRQGYNGDGIRPSWSSGGQKLLTDGWLRSRSRACQVGIEATNRIGSGMGAEN